MHISEIKRMHEEKEHLMRHEGTHPANNTEVHQHKHGMARGDMGGIDYNSHGVELQ